MGVFNMEKRNSKLWGWLAVLVVAVFLFTVRTGLGTRRHPIKQPPNICVSLGGCMVGDNGCAGPVCVVYRI